MRCNRRSTACRAGSGVCFASAPTRTSPPGASIDGGDVDETAALIDFVAVCRNYASELAINEVTLRTYSDLQQYVEKSTEALVQSLRGGDVRTRAVPPDAGPGRHPLLRIVVRPGLRGADGRAAEKALTGERSIPARVNGGVNINIYNFWLTVVGGRTYLVRYAFHHQICRSRKSRHLGDVLEPDAPRQGRSCRGGQRETIGGARHHDLVSGPERIPQDQAAGFRQIGCLLFESVEWAWRAGRTKYRVLRDLGAGSGGRAANCQLPGLPPVV